jgi:hypothetical protein
LWAPPKAAHVAKLIRRRRISLKRDNHPPRAFSLYKTFGFKKTMVKQGNYYLRFGFKKPMVKQGNYYLRFGFKKPMVKQGNYYLRFI